MIDESLRVLGDAEMDEIEGVAEARLKEARARAPDPEIVARVGTYGSLAPELRADLTRRFSAFLESSATGPMHGGKNSGR